MNDAASLADCLRTSLAASVQDEEYLADCMVILNNLSAERK